jgi:hypothetical protein
MTRISLFVRAHDETMTDPDEIGRAVAGVADILDALNVRWAVGGSVASAAHGEPRATNDVDLVAVLTEAEARTVVLRLGGDYYADGDSAAEAVRLRGSFNIIDRRSFIKLDVFVPGPGPLGLGQLDRKRDLDVFPSMRPVPVLGPEDVVLQKLRWYRLGGEVSDRQWRDIVSVLRLVRSELDDRYLNDVAAGAGLTTLLERARADRG